MKLCTTTHLVSILWFHIIKKIIYRVLLFPWKHILRVSKHNTAAWYQSSIIDKRITQLLCVHYKKPNMYCTSNISNVVIIWRICMLTGALVCERSTITFNTEALKTRSLRISDGAENATTLDQLEQRCRTDKSQKRKYTSTLISLQTSSNTRRI